MKIRLFRTSDDYHHHYRHWTVENGSPCGYVVALHGIQSHSGWYGYSSERFQDSGYDVRFLDRRGSGLNGCQRGHAPHYARLLNDVRQFLAEVKAERDRDRPGAPILLMGVSWGAKIATLAAVRFPELVDGLVLLYPGICAKVKPTPIQRSLLKCGLLLDRGQQRISVPLDDPALFTDEPEWQEYIKQDRSALHEVSLSFLEASLQMEQEIRRDAGALSIPLLVMLAGQDEIIDNDETLCLLSRFGVPRESAMIYKTARHTLEFDQNRQQIYSDVINWMNELSRGSSLE